jgi:CheY-like chemotaxis protein
MTVQRRILLADDDASFAKMIALRCGALGLQTDTASDGLGALLSVLKNPPDLLVLDINMPLGDGLKVCEKLLRDPKIPPIPVVFCSGRSDEETISRCKSLGAHYVVKDGEVWPNLQAIIRTLLGMSDEPAQAPEASPPPSSPQISPPEPEKQLPKVLFVDDDGDLRRMMQIRLRACGVEPLTAANAMQGLWIATKERPDVVITDYNMPEGSGEYFVARLRAVPMLAAIPIIVLTGCVAPGRRDFALERRFRGELQAIAFLTKPVDFDELLSSLSSHIQLDAELLRQTAILKRR